VDKGKIIGVVVPAYNEELLIARTIDTMPAFVDKIVVVDDASQDATIARVQERASQEPDRVILIQHETNQGVGGAIATGYKWCRDHEIDVAVVMAGDAQMDPADLPTLLDPVVADELDYAKGNRLFTGEAWRLIPRHRYLGNAFLSLLTKIASGYWHVTDSQAGYTAISTEALRLLPLERLYPRYGYPNHLLVMLNVFGLRVRDVPVRPVYNVGERSGIRLWKVIPTLSWLLFKCFLWRMREKYVIRDFHPLIFFYMLAFFLLFVSVPLFARIIWQWFDTGRIPPINTLAFTFTAISGMQSMFFAMWFDMSDNKDLR
jgi:glycosyltransferase involved in cell wall biosynthesis